MTFTFNNDLSTTRDYVRLYTGDTDETEVEFQDETIDALLTANGDDALGAAITLVRGAVAKYARIVSASVGRYSEQASDIHANWKGVLDMLVAQKTGADGTLLVEPGFDDDALNSELDGSLFDRHMMEEHTDASIYDDRDDWN